MIVINKRPYDRCMSGNPVMYEMESSLAAGNPDIFFEVKIRYTPCNNIFWTDLVTFPVYPTAGVAKIDLKEYLDSFLNYDLPDFNVNEKTPTAAVNQTAYFYIQFREMISGVDGSPEFDDSESEYPKFVMKGGLDYFRYRGDNFWVNYFNGYNHFLTWQQSGRIAALNERMYLAFLNVTLLPSWETPEVVGPNLWIAVQAFYTDGTSSSVQYYDAENYSKDIINLIPCGAEQWGLESLNPAKKIWYWKVRMEYTSASDGTKTALNDWFKFEADNRNDYNDVPLHYRNSLGGVDSVRLRGVIEKNLNYEFDQQARTFLPDYFSGKSITPARIIANSREQVIWKGDAGYLPKEDQERMRDMNVQRECWWEISEKWWPVNIITGNFKMKDSEDVLWNFPVEFSLAIEGDKFYTPNLDLGDRTFETNVCSAVISNISIDVDTSGATATIEVTFTVTPGTVIYYTYKIPGVHADPIQAEVADLPLVITGLAKEASYSLELRPICADGIVGKKFTSSFNTIGAGGGGGGGENVYLVNETGSNVDLLIDGVNSYSFGAGVNGNIVITNSGTMKNTSGGSRKFRFLQSMPDNLVEEVTLANNATHTFPADVSDYNYVRVTIP